VIIIQAGRGWGKTRRALAWLAQGQVINVNGQHWSRVLVCAYAGSADRIRREFGVPAGLVMDLRDWQQQRYARGVYDSVEVMLDDANVLVEEALGRNGRVHIAGITWNDDDEKYTEKDFWQMDKLRRTATKAYSERIDDQLEITKGQEQLNFE
jgi:hypothetical protein